MRLSRGSVARRDTSKPVAKCRSWRLRVRRDGEQLERAFSGTYSEAVEELARWRDRLAATAPADGEAPTFEAYASQWLRWREASGDFKPGTLANDQRGVRALLRAGLGSKRLGEVTPADVREALSWLRENPARPTKTGMLSGTSLNKLYVCANAILSQAADDGLIASNPAAKVKAPKVDTKEREALSPLEVELLLNRLDGMRLDGRVMALYLMLMLGLRRGEACAVMPQDVAGGCLHVRRSVIERTGRIGEPKSEAGVRVLPMPQRLRAKLAEWEAVRERIGFADAPTLCCSTIGGVIRPQLLQRWWEKVRGGLGCDGMTLHQLRHSNLSMMARFMPSAFDLQKWAGWSSLEPARVYIHNDIDALRAASAAAFDGRGAVLGRDF